MEASHVLGVGTAEDPFVVSDEGSESSGKGKGKAEWTGRTTRGQRASRGKRAHHPYGRGPLQEIKTEASPPPPSPNSYVDPPRTDDEVLTSSSPAPIPVPPPTLKWATTEQDVTEYLEILMTMGSPGVVEAFLSDHWDEALSLMITARERLMLEDRAEDKENVAGPSHS